MKLTYNEDGMTRVGLMIKRMADIITSVLLLLVLTLPLLVMFVIHGFKPKGKLFAFATMLKKVVTGRLSLVGPQQIPEDVIKEMSAHTSDYVLLQQIRPGLVSESRCLLGTPQSTAEYIRNMDMDIRYMRHRSLFMDLSVLLLMLSYRLKVKG